MPPGSPWMGYGQSLLARYQREQEELRRRQRRSDLLRSIAAGLRAFGQGAAQTGSTWAGVAMGARGGMEGYLGIQDAREKQRLLEEKLFAEQEEKRQKEADELIENQRRDEMHRLKVDLAKEQLADMRKPDTPTAAKEDRYHNPTLGIIMKKDPVTGEWVDDTPDFYRTAAKQRRDEDLERWAKDPEEDEEGPTMDDVAKRAAQLYAYVRGDFTDDDEAAGGTALDFDHDLLRRRLENQAAQELGMPLPHPGIPVGTEGFKPRIVDRIGTPDRPAGSVISSGAPTEQEQFMTGNVIRTYGASQSRGRPTAALPSIRPAPPKVENVDPKKVEAQVVGVIEKLPPGLQMLARSSPAIQNAIKANLGTLTESEIVAQIMASLNALPRR